MTTDEAQELELRKRQLTARTRGDGTALKGFKTNVVALRDRIAALEARRGE